MVGKLQGYKQLETDNPWMGTQSLGDALHEGKKRSEDTPKRILSKNSSYLEGVSTQVDEHEDCARWKGQASTSSLHTAASTVDYAAIFAEEAMTRLMMMHSFVVTSYNV
ncbi:hypothetical protein Q1695_015444 [Nippostrongylus brasiliensis]|nr:hypothetical protein Q1695_015444 [Nippostrongylus brasiliensis]